MSKCASPPPPSPRKSSFTPRARARRSVRRSSPPTNKSPNWKLKLIFASVVSRHSSVSARARRADASSSATAAAAAAAAAATAAAAAVVDSRVPRSPPLVGRAVAQKYEHLRWTAAARFQGANPLLVATAAAFLAAAAAAVARAPTRFANKQPTAGV